MAVTAIVELIRAVLAPINRESEMSILDSGKRSISMGLFQRLAPSWGPCWTWKAGLDSDGYGAFWFDGKTLSASRFSLSLIGTDIPLGMQPDHLCKVKKCINPSHLEVVTPRQNVLRTDSPPALNARKTHCSNGHPLSGDNLYQQGTRRRVCITCRRKHRIGAYWKQPAELRRFA